ncbi:hypothetical protein M9M90_03900 [Phenylobacterium sp. LH3H17]|uniref:hypothetical protein n=1 Tax=Phenylobacterium sp. LH3H17 TaxID=2903901 RepID=UPI0020C9C344|nr:hypothetical protein [Phenylobacterium sp. LH3H17]UTP40330.1 hypothetical protein M9M90_03900 [Phenylobacterium sp. LH3H17]
MLADFQQALADLTASPELCMAVKIDPSLLMRRYQLTALEAGRLEGIVRHPGMACSCMVYRANRLAPLALNTPRLCKALGPDLRAVASDYWADHPQSNVHFYVEADRFCRFVRREIERGRTLAPEVGSALEIESAQVAAALSESHTEAA